MATLYRYIFILFLLLTACEKRKAPYFPPYTPSPSSPTSQSYENTQVCSFNIQFLGSSKVRDNQALSQFLAAQNCHIVVVQELIAPPDLQTLKGFIYFQGESPLKPNEKSTAFFQAMYDVGFDGFWLSEADTGTSETNMSNGTNTEWWVTFYQSKKVSPKLNLPYGFISDDITRNPIFDRVPYAFSFQVNNQGLDFVLISTHLHPGPSTKDRARRATEINGIFKWIQEQKQHASERDFIILGDMNIEDKKELDNVLKESQFLSLNIDASVMTNTNVNGPKPYDHIFYDPQFTTSSELIIKMDLFDLTTGLLPFWRESLDTYPGNPYNHNLFRLIYSDHHPIALTFKGVAEESDDD